MCLNDKLAATVSYKKNYEKQHFDIWGLKATTELAEPQRPTACTSVNLKLK